MSRTSGSRRSSAGRPSGRPAFFASVAGGRTLSLPLLLAAAAVPLLLYARSATFDFVRADDADLIAGNAAFVSDLSNLPRAFSRSYFEVEGELTAEKTYYRPAAIASFMLDAAVGGVEPRVFHATNVVLHALVTCLLLALAVAWGASTAAALIAALLFAAHPLNAQAVAWVAGRNDLLAALFGLLSLLAFARASGSGRGTPLPAAGHTMAFAAALFSKETALLFPAIAVLHQRLMRRAPVTGSQRAAIAIDAMIVAGWFALRARALAGSPPELTPAALATAAGNLPHLLVHAGKMLLPINLNVAPGITPTSLLAGAAAIILFAWFAWRCLTRGQTIVALAWFLAFLLPTLLVPGLPVYEHRAYLPLLGLLVVGAGVAWSRPTAWGALVVAVLFTVHTTQRLDVFRNPFTYWTDAAADPRFGPLAHVNLGQLHEAAGRPTDARREYLRALERDPATPKAHNNLGVVLMALNEPDLAVTHFREETRRHPQNADAWFNLGLWHERRGEHAEARRYYQRALEANPRYTPARRKLG